MEIQPICITVFTPTYNRAYMLETLYRSLQRQTFRDFEWLVVDDGSTDGTAELISQWQKEDNPFPIRIVVQPNGGKHTAINTGLDHARGKLFFTVDSDDYLTEDALEKIAAWERSLPKGGKYCGVAGNLGTAPDQTVNTPIDGAYFDGTLLDRYTNIDGERAIAVYTDVHRKYRYPVFSEEKFMTEAVAWNRMAHDGYRMRFYNDIIWIYEYRTDGLTHRGNRLFVENPRGYCLWLREKERFSGGGIVQQLKLVYTLSSELVPVHGIAGTAECLEVPAWLVGLCRMVQWLHRKV